MTRTPSSLTLRARSTSIPFSPPTTVRFLITTPEARTTMPPRTTAPGLPTSVSSRVITSGPLCDARGQRHGRRPGRVRDAARGQEERGRQLRPRRPRGVRARRRPLRTRAAATGRRRARAPGRAATWRRRTREPAPSGAMHARRPGQRDHEPELERPERERDPARLVGEARGGRRATSRATPTPTISAAISTGHQRCSASASTQATASGAERRRAAASRPGLSACTTSLHRSEEAVRRVLRARPACRRPGTPTAPATPASASVRSSFVSGGHGAVGREHDPVAVGLEPVLGDELREQRLCAEPAPEAGGADDLRCPVHLRLRRGTARPPARAARPTRGRADTTARAARPGSPRARSAALRVEARRARGARRAAAAR